jgi:DNA-directed RNA polymerase subunit RPC12/RpoP
MLSTKNDVYENTKQNIKEQVYMCGSCKQDVYICEKDPIMCKKCGYRIVYKKRKTTPLVYSGR